jgi:2-C-methyl-D-erythritol 4-phosphate cytidylyltransferase
LAAESRIWAIVPAAGTGLRMQAAIPKQYLLLTGRAVIVRTLERLSSYPRISGILVGISPGDTRWEGLRSHWSRVPKLLGTYDGGATRANTVLNGLHALYQHATASDWVMVHDAVRPCVRHSDLDRLVDTVLGNDDGGLLALPLADTVKRADDFERVVETVPRERLWRALTPQLFRVSVLTAALELALIEDSEITDEAAAVEHGGGHPRLVAGRGDNIKITHPGDLALAELFLKQQENDA